MSKETPDELAGWRGLLREPDALPGQGLADKDAAWDKLFERLNARPRRRLFGYRIVAACLLVSLIPAARLFQGRPALLTKKPVAEKVRPGVPDARRPLSAVTPPPAVVTGHTKKTWTVQTPVVRPKRDPMPGDQSQPEARINPAPAPVAEPVAALPAGQPEAIPPAQAHPPKPAPKKQWKVVDINELEPGHDRPQTMVADRQFRPLRLGLDIGKSNLTTQNH